MKLKLLAGAAVATVFATSGALAQDAPWNWAANTPGWYGAIDLGIHQVQSLPLNINGQSPDGSTGFINDGFRVKTSSVDFAAFARIGYRVMPHLRLEVEVAERWAAINSVQGFGSNLTTTGENVVSYCNANATGIGDCGNAGGSV